ncbi:S9 family peptidase [Rhodococcus aerolatus]
MSSTDPTSASVPATDPVTPTGPVEPPQPLPPPVAAKVPHTRTHHGDTVEDPYEWLRDAEDPEVIAHLEAENAYTEQQLAHLAPLRERLFGEIKGRVRETDLSVPTRRDGWWYYGRTVAGQQHGLQCRCPVTDEHSWEPPVLDPDHPVPGEEVLLDGNTEAEGHDFYALGTFTVSEDHTRLAWATDTTGAERYTLRVRDLTTGEVLPGEVPGTSAGAVFSADGQWLFYLTVDESWRPDTVWRHRVGTPASDDVVVLHEPDERFWMGVGTTRSRRYLVVELGSKVTSEARVLDAHDPEGEWQVVLPRREGVEYSVEHAVVPGAPGGDDRFLLLHNDGAPNFTLVEAPVSTVADPATHRTVVAHRDDVRLEDVDAFAGHLVLSHRREATTRLALLTLADGGYGEPEEVAFDEELVTVGLAGNPTWDAPLLRLVRTSFTTPRTVLDLVLATGELVVRKRQEVLGGYDPEQYTQRRTWATAEDGTRVPVSLVHRRDVTGPAPLLLYGYGSYESSMDPTFGVARLSLLDRGVVFAVAHVRGGGEMGRHWYDDGKGLAKKNTFTDFVACARHLVAEGWTEPGRLLAEGGSAGGLLMGAVANLAPELFAGILAEVPFVDALTSILDPSLPLTVIEWDEWGDPLHDPDVYAYMRSYTPYENVRPVAYPPILAVTSLNDTRVLYVEPAKWVARLREVGTGPVPPLLKTEMTAGHGGVSGRYEQWRETAHEYAWVIDTLGAPHEPRPAPAAAGQ